MCNVGKLPLAPTPMASNFTHQVTFGPTATAPNPPVTMTTPVFVAATTTPAANMTTVPVAALAAAPTMMCVTSRAVEFDKGG